MSVATVFQVQVVGSVLLFALMATWYWAPRLARLPLEAALTPLLLLHLSRVLGLTFLVPTVVDPNFPRSGSCGMHAPAAGSPEPDQRPGSGRCTAVQSSRRRPYGPVRS
jgi:hypothetical protein